MGAPLNTLRALFLASVAALLCAPVAMAQEDIDDELDDILGTSGGSEGPGTVAEERRAIEREAETDDATVGELVLPEPKKKLIKTLQKKFFMKMGRFEAVPYVGIVTNDPFIQRILFGANVGYHITEIFEIELQGSYSPDLGKSDWKDITFQLTGDDSSGQGNAVAPEISKMTYHVMANFNYSPFYGKIATRRSSIMFDIYGTFGAGIVGTVDDLETTGKTGEPRAEATREQVHPAFTIGGGVRIAFNKTFALRFEGRTISYIGVLDSLNLELKNNLTLMLGASIFFGKRIE